MNAQNPDFNADNALSPMIVTFAMTSLVEAEREPIGKRWRGKGEWPVTSGVKSPAGFFIEREPCPGLDDVMAAIAAHIAKGGSAIIAGAPRPEHKLTDRIRRDGKNFIDAPSRLMISDMDGVQPTFEQDLSTPEAFTSGEIVKTIRGRFRAAGVHSLADAKIGVVATSSTGFPVNAKGEPANGEGRVRVLFETDEPLTLAEQKALMDSVGRLPMFSAHCPDTSINSPEHFIFIERAILPEGKADPISDVVMVSPGKAGREIVDVQHLARELKLERLDEASGSTGSPVDWGFTGSGLKGPGVDKFQLWTRFLHAPEDKREPLLRALVEPLPNDCPPKGDGGMNKWIGVGKAIWGACGGEAWGFPIWAGWCAKWPDDDPEANAKEWAGFKADDANGIHYLLKWARKIGTVEALAAVAAIEAAKPQPESSGDEAGDGGESKVSKAKLRSIAEFVAEYKPTRQIVHELLSGASLYTFTARTGVGKTGWIVLALLAIATGRQDIMMRKVSKGRVAYCTAENPDGARMRLAVCAHHFGIDIVALGKAIVILDVRVPPEEIYCLLESDARENGPFDAVFVDTWQAFFDKGDADNRTDALAFTLRLRPLTQLPGGPVVVVATHPTKNAANDELIPAGGGTILNEVDGNITMARQASGLTEFGWQGKLRGLDFDRPLYRLTHETAPGIVDIEGDLVKLPVLLPATQQEAEDKGDAVVKRDILILRAMERDPQASVKGWGLKTGLSHGTLMRTLNKMAKEKPPLTRQVLGKWGLTKAGLDALGSLRG